MDNKITKTRLSNFLSYEWILLIILTVAAIVVWELVYTMTSVRLTVGQQYKIYYDEELDTAGHNKLYQYLVENDTFSFDVLEVSGEDLNASYNVLSARLSVQEGDLIVTSTKEQKSTDGNNNEIVTVRAKSLIDGIGDGIKEVYTCMSMDDLFKGASDYLKNYLKDGVQGEYAQLDYANLDESKIRATFLSRMEGDNRYRKDADKENGVKDECLRIKKLCEDTVVFKYFLENAPDEVFYRYTRYEQIYTNGDNGTKEGYKAVYERELAERPNQRYGINAEYLTGGKIDPSEYFKLSGNENAEDVVILVFDMLKYQPHLQFESISVYSNIIRQCSNIVPTNA